MAQYFTDFSEYTVDSEPSDWTKRFFTDKAFRVVEEGTATDGKALHLVGAAGTDQRYGFSWDAIDNDSGRANVEVVFKWKTNASSGIQIKGMLRGSGSDNSSSMYLGGVDNVATSGHRIQKYATSSATISTSAFSASTNTWYCTRFRVEGTSLKLRNWLATDSEPSTWNLESTDPSVTGEGWVGLFHFPSTRNGWIDWFGVGTNGDSAPSAQAGPAVKGVRVQLHDGGTPCANVTGLTAIWWDDPAPVHTDSAVSGGTVSTDANGWVVLNIDADTALNVSDNGHLLVYKQGATEQDDLYFAGRLPVVGI